MISAQKARESAGEQFALFAGGDRRQYRVAICGGRDFKHRDYLCAALDEIVKEHPAVVVATGDARGADALGRLWATIRKHKLVPAFTANWERFGPAAGPRRNAQLLVQFKPDVVVAFHGGRGTKNMVDQARCKAIPVIMAGGNAEDIERFQRNKEAQKRELARSSGDA